jgi:glycine/D-amino acid oxidase-like deaminating enzyme
VPTHPALSESEPRILWSDTPDAPDAQPPLDGPAETDLLVVGGGFTGLWAALQAKERDPERDVVLAEAQTIGFGASSRNGGFLSSSLTHGHGNGIERWPDEMPTLERLGRENLDAIRQTVADHKIDARLENTGQILVANEPHQVPWLDEAAAQARQLGWNAERLGKDAIQAEVYSPRYLGGVLQHDGEALVDPARLAWGLKRAAIAAGVHVYEHTPVTKLARDGAGLRAVTPVGQISARRAVLATNAFPSLAKRVHHYIAPVYDYVLATEPLNREQRASLGWSGRQGISDMGNRFHYYRLTADDRLVWGGFDAVYYFRGRVIPR